MAASSANSAAMMRSPSFSRSSSSTTRIGRPAATAEMASSIESRRLAWARESVMSDSLICVRGRTRGGGGGQGRRRPVEGDGPLARGQRGEFGGVRDAQGRPFGPVGAVDEFAAAVDMALADVSVEAPRGGSAALQIDAIACLEAAESGQTQ